MTSTERVQLTEYIAEVGHGITLVYRCRYNGRDDVIKIVTENYAQHLDTEVEIMTYLRQFELKHISQFKVHFDLLSRDQIETTDPRAQRWLNTSLTTPGRAIIMEDLGHNLKGRWFKDADICEFAKWLFTTIHALHAVGVVHCDIKPENIVYRDNIYHLIDFGFSKLRFEGNRTGNLASYIWFHPSTTKVNRDNYTFDDLVKLDYIQACDILEWILLTYLLGIDGPGKQRIIKFLMYFQEVFETPGWDVEATIADLVQTHL